MARKGLLATLVVALLGLIGVASVPVTAGAATGISVTPSSGLTDGQNVTVAWSGLPDLAYGILVCDGDLMRTQRCVVVGSGSGSTGSAVVAVPESFDTLIGAPQHVDCRPITAACNITLFHYEFTDLPSAPFFIDTAPISFADEVPRPALAVTPATHLGASQQVMVTLDHWQSGTTVTLDECRFDSGGCTTVATVADAGDHTETTATVTRIIGSGSDVTDCVTAPNHCFLRATATIGGAPITVSAPLWFLRGENFRIAVTPTSGGPGPREVAVSARGLADGFTYTAAQCAANGVCGTPVVLDLAGDGTGGALLATDEEVLGVSCLVPVPSGCRIVVRGTDGVATEERSLPVSWPDRPLVVSPHLGLHAGDPVVVRGDLDAPGLAYRLRRCVTRLGVDVCSAGVTGRTAADGTYQRSVSIRAYVSNGGGPISCRRFACRYELLVGGAVRASVVTTFAPR